VFLARQTKLFIKRTEGASGIEYAIIAAMVAVVIAVISPDVGTAITKTFKTITDSLNPPKP
jgi:pilus assembly protein Flp/PilA